MRKVLAILAALFLTGCALVRHDAVVEGVFPPDDAAWAGAVELPEGWAE